MMVPPAAAVELMMFWAGSLLILKTLLHMLHFCSYDSRNEKRTNAREPRAGVQGRIHSAAERERPPFPQSVQWKPVIM